MRKTTKRNAAAKIDMSKMPLDFDNYVPGLLNQVNNKLSADGIKVYGNKFGIGLADWRVLAYVGMAETGTGAEISFILGMDKAVVSRSLSVLIKKDLAYRRHNTGALVEVSLTPKGVEFYNEVIEVSLAREKALLHGFSAAERATVIDLLHRMNKNMPRVRRAADELS
ncbi:MAG: MarR family transcriptional regulator [Rhodobiaceae bacterium]|nr:MarR family transcriptional regulator [Rhodobiaceae bacterium]MCC0056214.1 MarR family transcriptional regulator [Rhodobiaceae bacterium]